MRFVTPSIPKVPARKPGDFWPAVIFFTTEAQRRREGDTGDAEGIGEMKWRRADEKGGFIPLFSVPLRLCGELLGNLFGGLRFLLFDFLAARTTARFAAGRIEFVERRFQFAAGFLRRRIVRIGRDLDLFKRRILHRE